MLNVRDLTIGYRGEVIGHDISLSVAPGEVFCLLGPNGCGKTTLFKTLLGLIAPLKGKLDLDGRDIAEFTRADFARRVGYVPQAQPSTFPFKAIEIVLMGRASRVSTFAAPSASDVAVARRSLDALGIAHLGERRFTEISGGERQLVLIARALAQEPALLIMDEPTASLDYGNQARVLETIRALSASGHAVVFSTHDPGHAFACAGRVGLMASGRIVAMGQPDDVVTSEMLQRLYGVGVAVAYVEQIGRNVTAPTLRPRENQL